VRLAKIEDGGGRHLDIQIYIITTVFIGRSYSNLSVGLYSLRDSSMSFKMGFVKIQDGGGRHLEKANTS
jgi:hypothetical protein